jgi:hypothetical protein
MTIRSVVAQGPFWFGFAEEGILHDVGVWKLGSIF